MASDIAKEILNEFKPHDGPSPFFLKISGLYEDDPLEITSPTEKGKQVLSITFLKAGVTVKYSLKRIDNAVSCIVEHVTNWRDQMNFELSALNHMKERKTFMIKGYHIQIGGVSPSFEIEMTQKEVRKFINMLMVN